uniref:Uncharacterized protein n=1 Tax=Rhizophora mucronata TaxID=61149 RepID=A0A2P2QHH7_RHIMU
MEQDEILITSYLQVCLACSRKNC